MITIQQYTENEAISQEEKSEIIQFLSKHLEQYGDPPSQISDALNYAGGMDGKPGGYVITARENQNNNLWGAVIINKTGMGGYIPENILVYIATDKTHRGKGIGKSLMERAIKIADGNMALHCEPKNPAMHLYTKLGFTSKYLEMRLQK